MSALPHSEIGGWARLKRVGWLLFKAWTTPQRICGCKQPRNRAP